MPALHFSPFLSYMGNPTVGRVKITTHRLGLKDSGVKPNWKEVDIIPKQNDIVKRKV